jgi:hypothetical protein
MLSGNGEWWNIQWESVCRHSVSKRGEYNEIAHDNNVEVDRFEGIGIR